MSDAGERADRGAVWTSAFRVQRDVALRVPINYVTVPAVSLRAACFAHNQYEGSAFRKCLQNLLDSGFQKFIVDVFWDAARQTWSLCPVSLDPSALSPETRAARTVGQISEPDLPDLLSVRDGAAFWPRQEPSVSSSISNSDPSTRTEAQTSSSSLSNDSIPASTAIPTPNPTNFTDNVAQSLFQVGPYACTSSITFSFLTEVLENKLDDTATTMEAYTTYLILNIHAAATHSSPESPALQPSTNDLPDEKRQLSAVLNGNLSSLLYTPGKLQDDQANLGDSWFDVPPADRPATVYYEVSKKGDTGDSVTPDGWPTEAYMEFKKYYRLVVGFGSVDPQMENYNRSADSEKIFASGFTESLHSTSLESSGEVTSGCLFSRDHITLASANSSWAVSLAPDIDIEAEPNTTIPIPSITNLTACGLSPLLNRTLSDVTADINYLPYLAFAHSTLWSWVPGQPTNTSDESTRRCAVMQGSSKNEQYPGCWRPTDCATKHRVACQDRQNPYQWSLSKHAVVYSQGDRECPSNTTFSVPHTALENSHLFSVVGSQNDPIFFNLNTLDHNNCWVTGINGTCPYVIPTDPSKDRLVVVPTVAAIIVFVLAALTIFVKCTANRRETKRGRRRRNVEGWEYEGVPS